MLLYLLMLLAQGPDLIGGEPSLLLGPQSAPYMIELKVKNVPRGTAIIWDVIPEDKIQGRVIKSEFSYVFSGPPGDYKVKARLIKGEDVTELKWAGTLTGGLTPPPGPPPPGPTPPVPPVPPTPPPAPVTSFHVVMVYESGATYTPAQNGAMYSAKVRSYLDTNCTPDANTKGWRMRDKDLSADTDTAFQKSMWDAVKPKLPNPFAACWAIEVNGKIDIVPLPADETAALALLKKYHGDK